MTVVLDTNVLVSALLSPAGVPAQIVKHFIEGAFTLAVSPPLLDELERVLEYPKIAIGHIGAPATSTEGT